ncbi:MAG: glutamate-cysteine ligase family protein [Candidatus Micrarchaeota archaeon]
MASILRRAKIGWEMEFFILDENGSPVNKANELIKALENEKYLHARKEISQIMIEIGSDAKGTVKDAASSFLKRLEKLVELSEKHSYRLLPLATYPGKTSPKLNDNTTWYRAKKSVLGDAGLIEASVCGYHFHYELPERIVKEERIETTKCSHSKDVFLNQYNFLIAIDPVGISLCQSSPFWQGKQLAKDCRILMYRDFALNDYSEVNGMHYYLPLFGSLPNYEFTLNDLRVMADKRKTEWIKILQKNRFKNIVDIMCVPTLKFMWGPLRINKIGTFEYRGPDINYPAYTMALTALMRYALEAIENQKFKTQPDDLGITEPFLLEDDIIYLPPYSHVRHLEYLATTSGLESETVYTYCKKLLSLVDKISHRSKKSKFLTPIRNILKQKKTISDEIIELALKNGYVKNEVMTDDLANYLGLYFSKRFDKEIEYAKKLCL